MKMLSFYINKSCDGAFREICVASVASSLHSSLKTVLGNLKWLMSQSYSSYSTKTANIVNGVFSTISHTLLYPLMQSQKVGVVIVDLFIASDYITLRNNVSGHY